MSTGSFDKEQKSSYQAAGDLTKKMTKKHIRNKDIDVQYYGVWNRSSDGGEGLVIINFNRKKLPYNLFLHFNDYLDGAKVLGVEDETNQAEVYANGNDISVYIDEKTIRPLFIKIIITHGTIIDTVHLTEWEDVDEMPEEN